MAATESSSLSFSRGESSIWISCSWCSGVPDSGQSGARSGEEGANDLPDGDERPPAFRNRRSNVANDGGAIEIAGRESEWPVRVVEHHVARGAFMQPSQAFANQRRKRARSAGQDHRRDDGLGGKSPLGLQDGTVGAQVQAIQIDRSLFLPKLQALDEASAAERLTCCWATQAQELPTDELGSGRQTNLGPDVGARAIEGNRLLRKPLEQCSRSDLELLPELTRGSARAVDLGGGRRRDQSMGSLVQHGAQPELVAADDPTGRVQDDEVAGPVRLWVERTLNAQRAEMTDLRHPSAIGSQGKLQIQLCGPAARPGLHPAFHGLELHAAPNPTRRRIRPRDSDSLNPHRALPWVRWRRCDRDR